MKCDKCGFIYRGDVERCPYCGNIIKESDDELLGKKIFFGKNISIKLSSLIIVLFINIFIIFFIMDLAILKTNFFVTNLSYIAFISPIFVLIAFKSKKFKILEFFIKLDAYIISALIISALFFKADFMSVDIRPILGLMVLPIYLIISTVLIVIFLFIEKWKFKNVEFVFFAPVHFLVALVVFIFNLVNKANDYGVFDFLNITESFNGLTKAVDILVPFATIFTVIFMIDFYIFIGYKIYHYARYKYGN